MNFRIHSFETLTSTLDEAAKSTYKHGDVITARFQSEGRGQRGNKWHSDQGANLMTTIVVEPGHIAVNEQFAISIIAALAVADTVQSFGIEGVKVKWPNDVYVGERKISGILIEHSFSSEMLGRSIIGIGINVEQREFGVDAGWPTSLHLLGARGTTVDEVLAKLCEEFEGLYRLPIEELHRRYVARLYRVEGVFEFEDKDGRFMASISGVDPHSGVITLKDTDGRQREYYFKEVRYL